MDPTQPLATECAMKRINGGSQVDQLSKPIMDDT
jgi:hypothetical protein